MLFNTTANPVQVDPTNTSGLASDGTTLVTTAVPTIDGTSEISGFGGAPGSRSSTRPRATPTSDRSSAASTRPTSRPTPSRSWPTRATRPTPSATSQIPITTAFGSNGLKTIEVYTTDAAGAQSNKVTLSFTLQATNIVVPPPTTPPGAPTLTISPSVVPVNGNLVTHLTDVGFSGTTVLGTFVTVTETWTNPPTSYTGPDSMTVTIPAADINSDGTFSFTFQDFTDPTTGDPEQNGTFTVSATATYTNYPNLGASPSSNVVTFEIDNTTPAQVGRPPPQPGRRHRDLGGQRHQRPHAVLHRHHDARLHRRAVRQRPARRPEHGRRRDHPGGRRQQVL